MKMIFFLIIAITIILMTAEVTGKEKIFPGGIGIYSHCIVMPIGKILLISRNDFWGALKFIENERREKGLYSKYQLFVYPQERGGFIKLKEAVISLKEPSKGFFYTLRRILQIHDDPFRYADKIEFKAFELFAHPADDGHSTVYFWNRPNKVDPQVRMAPTPWTQIEEVNLFDRRIKWFGYDEKRNWRVIPIDEIA